MLKKLRLFLGLGAALLLLFMAARQYFGFHYLHKYQKLRAEARSIERSFPLLEDALKKSIRFYKNPIFYKELGRLYFERALAENEFGTPEKREDYLDLAQNAFEAQIKRNPIDAWAYYDMGKVWMLFNYPLATYAEKAGRCYRKALEFNPANEFLNENILITFMAQWDMLNDGERRFTFAQLKKMAENNKGFIRRVRDRWVAGLGDDGRLKEILSKDQALWNRVKGDLN